MLYAISRELHAALRAQQVPIPVVFGPDVVSVGIDERIVVDYAGQSADTFADATSQHLNPAMQMRRIQGGKIRIYARSPLDGAAWHDHAERAEQILDHVLNELSILIQTRKNILEFGAGGFVQLTDEAGTEITTGAVYEFAFTVDRAIFSRAWDGSALQEVTIGVDVDLKSTTKVSKGPGPAGTPPPDAETAC